MCEPFCDPETFTQSQNINNTLIGYEEEFCLSQEAKKAAMEKDNSEQVDKLNGDIAGLKSNIEEQKSELQASEKEKDSVYEQLKSVNSSLESANSKV